MSKIMSKRFIFGVSLAGLLFLALFATSCSDRMGYSVMLWSLPEQNLNDGDIVPVYIKSNISQTYVIGTMDSDQKFEVPLWQITEPASKSAAEKSFQRYAEYQYQYARVALDGLPMRSEPVNTAKQVYRLRKDEVIKVLYKGAGAAVMSGSNAMEGDWLRVLTSDGTQGWCFSYNLRLFDNREVAEEAASQVADTTQRQDEVLQKVLDRQWYPDSYRNMVKSRTIDLEQLEKRYQFDTGFQSGTVQLRVPNLTVSFPYAGVEKTGTNNYKFTDTPISITIRQDDYIVVQYTDDYGRPTPYDFVLLDESVNSLISQETRRRQQLYAELESFGPVFSSSNYGKLTFSGENQFQWSGYRQLQPAVIPQGALGRGTVSFDYFLSRSLTGRYDGVMTFHFDKGTREVNFLYKIEETGLRLESAGGAPSSGKTISDRSSNPVVIFFSRQES